MYLFPELIPQTTISRHDGYEIVFLSPESNIYYGYQETAPHIVSLSGGLGSAFAAERAIQRYGREHVALWFADVTVEDPDLYRFLRDLMKRWGGRLYWYIDGRSPEQVWDEKKIIPNSLIAPCTYELKIKPFREFVRAMPRLPKIYIGYKFHETKRQIKTLASYAEAMPRAIVEYPLLWPAPEVRQLEHLCEPQLHIALPLLYRLGYDYNNCGGTCCRSGKGCWVRTLKFFPHRYRQKEEWEQRARSNDDARSKRSFYARQVGGKGEERRKIPVTLRQLRQESEGKLDELIPLCRVPMKQEIEEGAKPL